jgi:hypothetical protein
MARGDELLKRTGRRLVRSGHRPLSVISGLTRACSRLDPGESMFIGTNRGPGMHRGRPVHPPYTLKRFKNNCRTPRYHR